MDKVCGFIAGLSILFRLSIFFFVPVPCYCDDCGFVAEPEVRHVDSSSSILLSQDCFGYSRLFVIQLISSCHESNVRLNTLTGVVEVV